MALTSKSLVRRNLPDAFCVHLNDDSGYIVWPEKLGGRGFERPAIGLGRSARHTWDDALKNCRAAALPKHLTEGGK